MGKKKKLLRFAENETFDNFFQPPYREYIEGFPLKGKWHEFFGNDNPIFLELGCGKGEYTIAQACKYPDRNFIGIDIKGSRMYLGCKISQEEQLKNVAFVRIQIEMIEHIFGPDEVKGIWVVFPDPQLKKANIKKRLTSPQFLNRYAKILAPGSKVNLKTDNDVLYHYTMAVVEEDKHQLEFSTADLYNSGYDGDVMLTKTFYENIWLQEGLTIKYVRFTPRFCL